MINPGGATDTVFGYDQSNQRVYQGTYNPGTGAYSNEQLYFYGADGKKLVAYSLQNANGSVTIAATQTNVWFGGRLLTPEDRLQSIGKYFPYGEDRYNPSPANPGNDAEKFATYTRDSATGLDYAYQRYYGMSIARFLSVDPTQQNVALQVPGTLNIYAYTNDDPVNANDPKGLDTHFQNSQPTYGAPTCFTPFLSAMGISAAKFSSYMKSDVGKLGITAFLEFTAPDFPQNHAIWKSIASTFINRWKLTEAQKKQFGFSNHSFTDLMYEGSQVWHDAGLTSSEYNTISSVLNGRPDSDMCKGIVSAFGDARSVYYNGPINNSLFFNSLPGSAPNTFYQLSLLSMTYGALETGRGTLTVPWQFWTIAIPTNETIGRV